MKLEVEINGDMRQVNLDNPIDLSLPIAPGMGPKAWYVNDVSFSPVMEDGFVGDVKQGGAVNFMNVQFNPHGNGTHTECVAHISDLPITIYDVLKPGLVKAKLITIEPHKVGDDQVIDIDAFDWNSIEVDNEALVIRTHPNDLGKKSKNYSDSNPAYFTAEAMHAIVDTGIKHLLIDLPSVDREKDGGRVEAHHIFWNYPNAPQTDKTITELIYVNDDVSDGRYVLDLQIAPFALDASPSRPVLYALSDRFR